VKEFDDELNGVAAWLAQKCAGSGTVM